MRTVGENVRELRNRRGFTQPELGALTKLGVTRISDIERNRYKNPDTTTLITIAEALGCSIDDLLFGPEDELRDAVLEWPLFDFLKRDLTDVQPYPESDKWKTLMIAYETIVTRATRLAKAVGIFQKTLGLDNILLDMPDIALPRIPEEPSEQPHTRNDLVRHTSTGQIDSPPEPGESDVPASDRRIEDLERQITELRARLDQTQDVARRLTKIAARTKGRGATGATPGPRGRH